MRLLLLSERYAILRLTERPERPNTRALYALTETPDEISLVCTESDMPEPSLLADPPQLGYRALRIAGTVEFSEIGILARLSSAIAAASVPLFAISTYRTDYLLVPEDRLHEARSALEAAGCAIEEAA